MAIQGGVGAKKYGSKWREADSARLKSATRATTLHSYLWHQECDHLVVVCSYFLRLVLVLYLVSFGCSSVFYILQLALYHLAQNTNTVWPPLLAYQNSFPYKSVAARPHRAAHSTRGMRRAEGAPP